MKLSQNGTACSKNSPNPQGEKGLFAALEQALAEKREAQQGEVHSLAHTMDHQYKNSPSGGAGGITQLGFPNIALWEAQLRAELATWRRGEGAQEMAAPL
jgi:hypothetical protein